MGFRYTSTSMNSKSLFSNPCSHRTKFTRTFLRALARINKKRPTSSSHREVQRHSHKIQSASYACMASAVGYRRAWSRAMLWKLRSRALIRSRVMAAKKKRVNVDEKRGRDLSRVDVLRQLVPGGEAMDFCNLLEETAHYIKCLTTQVQVMRSVADFYST